MCTQSTKVTPRRGMALREDVERDNRVGFTGSYSWVVLSDEYRFLIRRGWGGVQTVIGLHILDLTQHYLYCFESCNCTQFLVKLFCPLIHATKGDIVPFLFGPHWRRNACFLHQWNYKASNLLSCHFPEKFLCGLLSQNLFSYTSFTGCSTLRVFPPISRSF